MTISREVYWFESHHVYNSSASFVANFVSAVKFWYVSVDCQHFGESWSQFLSDQERKPELCTKLVQCRFKNCIKLSRLIWEYYYNSLVKHVYHLWAHWFRYKCVKRGISHGLNANENLRVLTLSLLSNWRCFDLGLVLILCVSLGWGSAYCRHNNWK
jgi:hypothetical protein